MVIVAMMKMVWWFGFDGMVSWECGCVWRWRWEWEWEWGWGWGWCRCGLGLYMATENWSGLFALLLHFCLWLLVPWPLSLLFDFHIFLYFGITWLYKHTPHSDTDMYTCGCMCVRVCVCSVENVFFETFFLFCFIFFIWLLFSFAFRVTDLLIYTFVAVVVVCAAQQQHAHSDVKVYLHSFVICKY